MDKISLAICDVARCWHANGCSTAHVLQSAQRHALLCRQQRAVVLSVSGQQPRYALMAPTPTQLPTEWTPQELKVGEGHRHQPPAEADFGMWLCLSLWSTK